MLNDIELALRKESHLPIIGVDEAGRGALAGPVVVAALCLNPQNIPTGIKDSKQLSKIKRENIARKLQKSALFYIATADAKRIDRINILNATLWAMAHAINQFKGNYIALIDGNKTPNTSIKTIPIIGGDRKSLSIAAASIIAKTTRDQMMEAIHQKYPQYGFKNHKGYGTKEHINALRKWGITQQHRLSFKPIKNTPKT